MGRKVNFLTASARKVWRARIKATDKGRHTPKMPNFPLTLAVTFVAASFCAWLIFAGMAQLTGGNLGIWPEGSSRIPPNRLFDLTRSTVTAAGLLAGVFAIVYAYRKQKIEEAGSLRADAESLGSRYQDAAAQLGDESPAVRLAGVYALSRLADDDSAQRETICRLLCGYLRIPYDPDVAPPGEAEVRHTVIRVIAEHLQEPEADESWCGFNLNFSGAVFDGGSFSESHFVDSLVDFSGARFVGGTTSFDGCTFERVNVDFGDGESLPASFEGGRIHFIGARFKSGAQVGMVFAEIGPSVSIEFGSSEFYEGCHLAFHECVVNSSFISFGGPVWQGAKFMGGDISFSGGSWKSGVISFMGASFEGSAIRFGDMEEFGASVMFEDAEFKSGSVTLDLVSASTGKISFTPGANPGDVVTPWPVPAPRSRWRRRLGGRRHGWVVRPEGLPND
ncbi:pentapeptide repeat-containing protein [Streptomyces kroppenstedtii]|uniref:pentapeptide repeat-containing protein n=1 Tax=Streptomyces kroppenstedtii TaxID=3051181 RepID=UPI0028D5783D|nr:pentapeptide repeat-containing protein [Streptomyces sp. DSM 40484]